MPDRADWMLRAALVVGAVTVFRLAALWFNQTDLFVDESQYWLWGQRLDFGYYSKPPLIAWVIRAVTELAGSDAPFWVRMPGAILHAITAMILGALAARLHSARAAFFVALAYVTLPLASLGSLLISTDTIMAPFYAAALYYYFRLEDRDAVGDAVLGGVCLGLAFLAKYAAIYFLIGAGLASIFAPGARLSLRSWAILLSAFAATIAPNVLWNLANDLTTVGHTMDNVGWVRGASRFASLNSAGLAEFFFSQFAVFGPVLFAALIWAYWRGGMRSPLLWFSLPPLAIVCVQALLSKAYANWAVAAYFAGTLIAVPLLLRLAPRLLSLSFAINGAVAVLLPVLTILAPAPVWKESPLLSRYLGRADLSHQIIAAAIAARADAIVASERDVLADLFYTGGEVGMPIYALPTDGRPQSYYDQNFPLPDNVVSVLYVSSTPPECNGALPDGQIALATDGGAYRGREIVAYLIPGSCLTDAR